MLGVFVVAGLFLMPLDAYAWRYAHFAVALAVCFLLSMTVGMGAGDAKYIAAVAPFVALPDLGAVAYLYAGWSIVLLIGMMVARRSTALRTASPDWIWFAPERKGYVPFGLALAPTLSSYLFLGAIG
jgi:prepilin peptidase CpaA